MPGDPTIEALRLIHDLGGIDGGHHKQWLLDQIVRTLTGCPIETREAVDSRGASFTHEVLGESDAYREWVRAFEDGEDGPRTYEWDTGCPP